MKEISSFFKYIIFYSLYFLTNGIPCHKSCNLCDSQSGICLDNINDNNINTLNRNDNTEDMRKLEVKQEIICNIKFCQACKNKNICSECQDGFFLIENQCFKHHCKVFGFCDLCDEYDCLKCKKKYKLYNGTCYERKHAFEMKLALGIGIPIIIIALGFYLYKYQKKRFKRIIESGKILSLKHPKAGNYLVFFPERGDSEMTFSKCISPTDEGKDNIEKVESSQCIICGNKKIYTFADCGCAICYDHFNIIKSNKEAFECRIHRVRISKDVIFKLGRTSKIKGNSVEKLGLKICPICKINYGTQSFNCDCDLKMCEHCFNEYVFILKYNLCPGCGKPYIPKSKKNKEIKTISDSTANISIDGEKSK